MRSTRKRGRARLPNYTIWRATSWHDAAFKQQRRKEKVGQSPVNIYEVHLGSWQRYENGASLSYRDLAEQLVPYVKDLGYQFRGAAAGDGVSAGWLPGATSVPAILPPPRRYGTPKDFMYFVDQCHRRGDRRDPGLGAGPFLQG